MIEKFASLIGLAEACFDFSSAAMEAGVMRTKRGGCRGVQGHIPCSHMGEHGIKAENAYTQAGKVERHIKSEAEPKDNSGPVTVVTANTFDSIVFGGKDVLIGAGARALLPE
jgi:hypothetical protein